jgi:ribosomal protein L16/L10AE
MGKGKGSFDHFMMRVNAGAILFELQTLAPTGGEILARQAYKIASSKLPLKLSFVRMH